jgi:subtilisin family serine protease
MLKDGTYAAWFKTPLREGAGIVHFANGKIWGGDSIISYSGSYEVDGNRWTATVLTRRHSAGHATVFGPGIDEMELKLAGTSNGKIAQCSGTTDAAPGVAFEATLILSEDQPPAPGAVSPAAKVRGRNKLPKLSQRLRAR